MHTPTRFAKRIAGMGALLAAHIMVTLPALAQPVDQGFASPHDASLEGHRIDSLINVTLYFMAGLFLIMVAWMLIAVFKHNKKHTAVYAPGSKRSKLVPLGFAAFCFVVVDGNLFYHSTLDMEHVFWNFKDVDKRPDVVRVEVNAHQWAWDFRYPGPDGKFNTDDDIVSLNDLRVPVNRPILLQMASVDVVHSLYLPNFRVKMDVVPGSVTSAWFQATETGRFEVACAQHCGAMHYKMRAELTVLPGDEFASWSERASALSRRAYDPKNEDSHWGWEWKTY